MFTLFGLSHFHWHCKKVFPPLWLEIVHYQVWEDSIEHLHRYPWLRLANRGRFLLRTRAPVPFWIVICSNVKTIHS